LGLLLLRGEHSAGRDGAKEHPGGCQDGLFPAAAGLDPRRVDAHLRGLAALGASDDAHPDATPDESQADRSQRRAGAVEKLAGRGPGVRARAAYHQSVLRAAREAASVARAPYKRAVGRFAGRSCAARVAPEQQVSPRLSALAERSRTLQKAARQWQ